MLIRTDIRGKLEDLGIPGAVFQGMRPAIQIKDDYLTTSLIELEGPVPHNGEIDVSVCFISPKYYPNSLWIGKKMKVYVGAKVIGYLTVTEIINPVLDRDADTINHIEVQEIETPYGYKETHWTIDGKALADYMDTWASESKDEYLKSIVPFSSLYPAWGKELEWSADIRFVWKLIEMDSVVLPLLVCEDDLDFSCIVILVEVEKTKDFVYWNRIGYVLHEKENFEEEKKNGILNTKTYSQEDWEKYGDNIALENVDSPLWKQWISENWEEELYRRRMNYTLPFYQTEGNICWIKDVEWVFDKSEYDQMTNTFKELEIIKKLENIPEEEVINTQNCANMMADLAPNGKQILEEHMKDFDEILLHVLAGELVTEPLIDLLKFHTDKKLTIQAYCKAIEAMWKNGNDEVVNVVDVTILERLSDENKVWQKFGGFISTEFKQYINHEVLHTNLMMTGVHSLE